INPAVSLGVWLTGGMKLVDFIGYVVEQCIGAITGGDFLALVFNGKEGGALYDQTGGLGSNGLAGVGDSWLIGLIVEVVLTFVFVLAILGVTSKAQNGRVAGIVIGLTLTLVHILGIGLTGTSVNPARSLGPAIFAGGSALSGLWVFIVGPFLGAAVAVGVYLFLEGKKSED
ncbi:MAG: aquaporin, partial [Clostridia bacterium]|nr:aquaporin [Clostridia bacterium]